MKANLLKISGIRSFNLFKVIKVVKKQKEQQYNTLTFSTL
ncbi:MAG: hypothetical protein JWP44_4705 [Mucilaginibacter sp.]|nr:hypothetical protein [Mucilaginibacter sp.]